MFINDFVETWSECTRLVGGSRTTCDKQRKGRYLTVKSRRCSSWKGFGGAFKKERRWPTKKLDAPQGWFLNFVLKLVETIRNWIFFRGVCLFYSKSAILLNLIRMNTLSWVFFKQSLTSSRTLRRKWRFMFYKSLSTFTSIVLLNTIRLIMEVSKKNKNIFDWLGCILAADGNTLVFASKTHWDLHANVLPWYSYNFIDGKFCLADGTRSRPLPEHEQRG